MKLYDMAGHLIRRLHQISGQLFQQRMTQIGVDLTPVQFATLQALHRQPDIEQAQVAHNIAYDRATIGGVIDRLEQKGYIKRTVSPKDRRAKTVSLTTEGKEIYEQVFPEVDDLQNHILKNLDDEEKAQLTELLKKAVGFDAP